MVILLWNADEADCSRKGLKVEKNRQGARARIGLEFLGDSMSFREVDAPLMGFKRQRQKTPFDDE